MIAFLFIKLSFLVELEFLAMLVLSDLLFAFALNKTLDGFRS
jgi:hypothetical protein